MQISKVFIQNFKRGGEKWFDRIIIMDEIWLYYFDLEIKIEFSIWKYWGLLVLKKVKVVKFVGK